MIKYILFIAIVIFTRSAFAQSTDIPTKIANKMKDTLQLTTGQRNTLYAVNVQLQQEKKDLRNYFMNNDSLRIMIQKVEKKRDSLYKDVLSDDKYLLYKQKKANLINNN